MKKQKINCDVCDCKHYDDCVCSLDEIKVDYSKEIEVKDDNCKDKTCCDNYKKK